MENPHKYWLNDHLEVRVFTADVVTIGTDWKCRNYPLEHWRLYLNSHDGAKLHLGREVFLLKKNCVFIIPAGLRFRTSCDDVVEHLFIHFNISGMPDLALRTLFRHIRVAEASSVLDAMLNELREELRSSPVEDYREHLTQHNGNIAMQWRLKAVIYQAIACCVRGISPKESEACWQLADEVRPLSAALRFIEENLAGNLSNSYLAELCGLSCEHFNRVFKVAMKQTPAVFVRERRLAEASRLLMFSDRNIETIAKNTGFYDRAHLSRTFKAFYGVSPNDYRVSVHGTLIETKT